MEIMSNALICGKGPETNEMIIFFFLQQTIKHKKKKKKKNYYLTKATPEAST